MSYDLVVFEKSKIPTDRSGFLRWYEQKKEYGGGQDISCASEKLQHFFHSVRKIFPPVSGSFAPDDKIYSEQAGLEKYRCDYDICGDMIYISFSYSVSEFAYDTVKRAAYFTDVGFFDPNRNSLPVLFENRCPMLLEGEWFRPVEADDFDCISEKLGGMTMKNHSYLYVTDQIGNYIQVGGYGDSFTVEKRMYQGMTAFEHTKAGYFGAEYPDKAGYVMIAGNRVKVKQNQILSRETTEQLFSDFFRGAETVEAIEWTKMDM